MRGFQKDARLKRAFVALFEDLTNISSSVLLQRIGLNVKMYLEIFNTMRRITSIWL